MVDLTQFKIKINNKSFVYGEYEGNEISGKLIVFSHGFGVKRDSWGMFNELGDLLKKDYLIVRFDYNKIVPDENSTYVDSYTKQTQKLKRVIEFMQRKFNIKETNIIAHSMGCLIAGLLEFRGITKIILNAPPPSSPYKRMKMYFSKRSGTIFNESALSKIERSDGSWTYLNKDFWPDIKTVNPPVLYERLTKHSVVSFIRAMQDEVITGEDYKKIKDISKISYFEIDGNHNFSGKNRKGWLELVVNEVYKL